MDEQPKKYEIGVLSDTKYEKLIAEIYIGDQFVGFVQQEQGADKLVIELSSPSIDVNSSDEKKFDLETFVKAVGAAKKALTPEHTD